MKNLPPDAPDKRSEPSDRNPAARTAPASGVPGWLLLAIAAVAMWLGAWLLPAKTPIGSIAELWRGFALALLRDALVAGGCLAAGAAVACCRFRRVVALERRLWTCDRRVFLLVASIAAVAISGSIACFVLDRVPHIQDEVAMLFQAKNFARGTLWAPTPPKPIVRFFEYEFIVVDGPRMYGKYFLGPSLLLVPGVWLGAPWIINPLLGGVAILLVFALARELFDEKTARVAVLLTVVSPFRAVTFSFMMAHGGCLVLTMLFALYLIRAARSPRRYRYACVAGACLGAMVNFRPFTAALLALPIGIGAAIVCRWRELRVESVLAFALPLAVGVAVFLGYNAALTGDPTLTPFERWSKTDRLGFGPDRGMSYWQPFDRGHDLANAAKNLYLNLNSLGVTLLGWGRGTLLLMAAAFLVRSQRVSHALGAAVMLAVIIGYSFYHFGAFFPMEARYWSESMAFMLFLVAGGLTWLRIVIGGGYRRCGWSFGDARARSALWLPCLSLTVWTATGPYATFVSEMRQWGNSRALRQALRDHPVHHALVLIPAELSLLDDFTAGAAFNAPARDGDIVFARQLTGQDHRPLLEMYRDRKAYRFVNDGLDPPHLEPFTAP